jgi:hypothetical protein
MSSRADYRIVRLWEGQVWKLEVWKSRSFGRAGAARGGGKLVCINVRGRQIFWEGKLGVNEARSSDFFKLSMKGRQIFMQAYSVGGRGVFP